MVFHAIRAVGRENAVAMFQVECAPGVLGISRILSELVQNTIMMMEKVDEHEYNAYTLLISSIERSFLAPLTFP